MGQKLEIGDSLGTTTAAGADEVDCALILGGDLKREFSGNIVVESTVTRFPDCGLTRFGEVIVVVLDDGNWIDEEERAAVVDVERIAGIDAARE